MGTSKPTMTGAQIFFECLKNEGVKHIFGYPGGATLKIYEELHDVDFLEHIMVRHEQGAVHMAEGYAKVTGKVGVVITTSGPGATNTVTGIADAYMDSVPLVVFTGQVPTHLIGNDAFQEADIVGITRPITKHNFLVKDVNELAATIKKAFYIASSGRPGPVVVDIPKDVTAAMSEFEYPEDVTIRGYKPGLNTRSEFIKEAARKIKNAKRPLLYVGGGVIMSDGSEELRLLARENNLPVTMTLQGLGAFPGNEKQSLGMLGMHGTYWANQAVTNCDVLVALGARFDDRVTGKVDTFAKDAYKIHVDIDPTAIDKNVKVDLPIVGDVKHIMAELASYLNETEDLTDWWSMIEDWQEACPLDMQCDKELRINYIVNEISERTNGEAIVVSDVGQHQMWIAQYYKFTNPRSHLSSGGLGTMGFSVPAAIGAAIAHPERNVISLNGDGGFQMNMQELITAAYYKLPITFIILNNNYLGMVRQWQELFHQKKYTFTDMADSNPDFVKIGEAMGVPSFKAESKQELIEALNNADKITEGPKLIECTVLREDMVFPMVPAGASVGEMITERYKVEG